MPFTCTKLLSREEIRKAPVPNKSKDVPEFFHNHVLPDFIAKALEAYEFKIIRDEWMVNSSGLKLYGQIALDPASMFFHLDSYTPGSEFVLLIRNGNSGHFNLSFSAGIRFADNNFFVGNPIPVLKKYKNRDAQLSVEEALNKFSSECEKLLTLADELRASVIGPNQAARLVIKATELALIDPRHILPFWKNRKPNSTWADIYVAFEKMAKQYMPYMTYQDFMVRLYKFLKTEMDGGSKQK